MIAQSMHTVVADRIDENSWRICDTSRPSGDASSLLAYVQRWGDNVQVVWLAPTDLPRRFASLDDALEAARMLGAGSVAA